MDQPLPHITELNLHEIIVLEWSFNNQSFHTHSLLDALQKNSQSCLSNNPCDYIIVAVCRDAEQAATLSQMLSDKRIEIARLNVSRPPAIGTTSFDELMKFIGR